MAGDQRPGPIAGATDLAIRASPRFPAFFSSPLDTADGEGVQRGFPGIAWALIGNISGASHIRSQARTQKKRRGKSAEGIIVALS